MIMIIADCFKRLLKKYLFTQYQCIQHVRGSWGWMRYINLLTYLVLTIEDGRRTFLQRNLLVFNRECKLTVQRLTDIMTTNCIFLLNCWKQECDVADLHIVCSVFRMLWCQRTKWVVGGRHFTSYTLAWSSFYSWISWALSCVFKLWYHHHHHHHYRHF